MEQLALDEVRDDFIAGQIEAIFFENANNFYKVMLVTVTETNTDYLEKEIVVTGTFGQIQEEENYRFYGKIVNHPRYGDQFQVSHYEKNKPTSASGLIHYLSSDKFPGIGKKTAEQIVDTLGLDAIDQIMNDANCLEKVPRLNEKKRQTLATSLAENYGLEQIVIGLNQYGFGNQLAFTIYSFYKSETLKVIEENPYQLVEDIEGIGFTKADHLAEHLGIQADSPQRIQAAIIHELFQGSLNSGNTYLEARQLLELALDTLEKSRRVALEPKLVADMMIQLAEEGRIIQEGTKLYEKSLYFSEVGIATSIQRLMENKKKIKYPQKEIDDTITLIEKNFDIEYGDSQIQAIKEAIQSPFFILTGGPGTGKTTVINGIVNLFAELNGLSLDPADYTQAVFPILLAAPTGRAAKRMNETTGLPSSTIHRLLGLTGREKEGSEEAKEVEGGLLIVDEFSMVDTWLANTLLKSLPSSIQVIFVGDKDQLPSVGPGQVLTDLLDIPDIPKRELVDIYRQEDGSTIISLAHEIKNGQVPSDLTVNKKDRSFINCSVNQMESVVEQIVVRAKDKGFDAKDIQVLAPMYRGKAGINQLNELMQEILNPNPTQQRKEVKWLDKIYRIGDKVLHLVNSPESNVFNGDIGEIVGINMAKETDDKVDELILQFDESEITYKRNEWNKITLAYSCSIHKAQGSEFKMVILPMVRQYGRMLQRKLLYTAVTRSKDLLILLGEPQAYQLAIESEGIARQTSLKARILGEEPVFVEVVKDRSEQEMTPVKPETQTVQVELESVTTEPQDFRLTPEMVSEQRVDPLIGMEDVTPHQFMSL